MSLPRDILDIASPSDKISRMCVWNYRTPDECRSLSIGGDGKLVEPDHTTQVQLSDNLVPSATVRVCNSNTVGLSNDIIGTHFLFSPLICYIYNGIRTRRMLGRSMLTACPSRAKTKYNIIVAVNKAMTLIVTVSLINVCKCFNFVISANGTK